MRQNQRETLSARRGASGLIITALLLLTPMLVGACSLTNLPIAKTTPTPRAAQVVEPSPTARPASQSQAKATPRPTQDVAQNQVPQQAQPPDQGGAAWQVPAERQAAVQVVERAGPAVVTVVNRLDSSQGFTGEARGSGVIIDQDGRIITNNHVVERAGQGGLTVMSSHG